MIVTQKKPKEAILKMLGNYNNIFLVGCGECSTICHSGGEKEVLEMKEYLEVSGKKVTAWVIPSAPCLAAQIKTSLAANTGFLRISDAILVLACGLGVQSVKENNRLSQEVIPALDSIAGARLDAQGNFQEVCSNCGECILDSTGCICPLTRCAKGLLNGPCGGVIKGKCEVDRERDCAWVLIYKEMEKRGALGKIKNILPPKAYSKTTRPHKILVN